MKFNNLSKSKDLTSHQIDCILNDAFPAYVSRFKYHWENANSFDEFKKLVKLDSFLSQSQAVGELFKDDTGYLINQINPFSTYLTSSDAGSIRIVAGEASFLISNGIGDGTSIVSFKKHDTFNTHAFTFQTCVYGKFSISSYDSKDVVGLDVEGDFMVYSNNGFVIFEQLTDHMVIKDRNNLRCDLTDIYSMFYNDLSTEL